MGFDGVVKNINKYCYVDYDAFFKKYLFSLFLVDFSRFVVNHICANEIDKEEKDLLDCINQFMGTEDYEVYSDWFEIIEGELSRIYCNSCDIDTFFDNVPSFVINLRAALLVYRDACSFIDLGRDYFERGLIDLQNGYEAITGFELFESDFMYFSGFFENASNWCVSSSLDDLFNKFILKHGVSEYFTDILLNKILFSVLGGRLKLSSPMRRMLLKSILSSNLVSDENLGEGVELIYNKFGDVLQKEGVEEIPAKGEKFDLNKHEALMVQESDDVENGYIIDELMKGYMYKDKVLKYSKVIVCKK